MIYQYKNAGSGYCDQFEVLGNTTEYICAAFSGDKEKEQTTVVRLDDKGKPYYVTVIPAKQVHRDRYECQYHDGSVIVTGIHRLMEASFIKYGRKVILFLPKH